MSKLVFFDCEFTDLAVSGSIISAGFVAKSGEEFYAESADFKDKVSIVFVTWMRTAVGHKQLLDMRYNMSEG